MSKLPFFIKEIIGNIGYRVFQLNMKLTKRKPNVMNEDDTVKSIIKNHASIARYGDGEFLWIFQKRAEGNFEKNSSELSYRLNQVLTSNYKNLYIGIPNIFNTLSNVDKKGKVFWEGFLIRNGFQVLKLLNFNRQYYSSQFTRPYIDYLNSGINFNEKFSLLKQIWNKRDVLIIEGEKTRFGVNSDLLNNAKSVQRIICPAKNAFESYDNILNRTSQIISTKDKKILVLVALGPTATILTYDLTTKYHIQTIDIGHLDVEYEWYKMHASTKIPIAGKYIEESKVKFKKELPDTKLKKYKHEIISTVR